MSAVPVQQAAIAVLAGSADHGGVPRRDRHNVTDKVIIAGCPADCEFVAFEKIGAFYLELKLVGTDKKLPLRLFA